MEQNIDDKLQKAAEEYADCNSQRWHEDGDIYYDHSNIMDAFIAGAQWQRNHVWHDISEKPTEAKADLMIDNKYWCYLEDIIPTSR